MVTYWLKELKNNAKADIVIVLVGNKTDLEKNRVIDREEVRAFAARAGAEHMETSAKSGSGVDNLFLAVLQKMVKMDKSTTSRKGGTWHIGAFCACLTLPAARQKNVIKVMDDPPRSRCSC